ncbi:piggyBac transposable element-derived protein 3-like isoform X1 [Sparus aurata]|uniref:piggyBac transposable element-derived protein 3-like isoform X1 n=2 Tax=Sparus aurata TaxID=8175 RepID=UPI0011C0E0F6|nr:piggyBac transposable element-derived protein 3-like isoform X1 [Sparus aurata]
MHLFDLCTCLIGCLLEVFYDKMETVVPADPAISDDEGSDEEDDDVAGWDFVPPTHNQDTPDLSDMGPSTKRRKCVWLAVEVLKEEEEDEGYEQPAPQARKTTLKKVELDDRALPEYQRSHPDFMESPFQYFSRYFSPELIELITCQTNLYASQKDIDTTFTTSLDEMMNFVAILVYMGIAKLPSVYDYWAMETRVPQVANLMSSKRFSLMKRLVHFNDNTQIPGTVDRFFKIRPLFSLLNTAFRRELQTPKQSVDSVMVAYKGKTAGNLRQYIKNKPHKWGFKLFARASDDGFIHDMVLYQGKTTLEAHGVPLTPEQQAMGATSQIVSVLLSTISSSSMWEEPMSSVHQYCSDAKRKVQVSCPAITKSSSANMVGTDKSNMLVHLYRTPWNSKRWYMQLFAYAIDVSLTNAWVIYRRDCKALGVAGLSLKNFRLQVFKDASSQKPIMFCPRRSSTDLSTSVDVPRPVRGHRRHTPADSVRFGFDPSNFHAPVYTNRQTCKHCSRKGNIRRSNVTCRVCKVHLCLNAERNCFIDFHESAA